MHPTHERAMRRALGEAVQDLQQGLGAMDATALRGLRDGLIPALVDIDGSALAMAREYAASVRAMNRDIMDAVSCALQAHAHTAEVADELHHAYDSAHEALAALQRLWPGAKTRNRGLRALLDLKDDERLLDHVGRLLAYVGETYGVAEPTPAARPGTRARRKARRSSVMAAV